MSLFALPVHHTCTHRHIIFFIHFFILSFVQYKLANTKALPHIWLKVSWMVWQRFSYKLVSAVGDIFNSSGLWFKVFKLLPAMQNINLLKNIIKNGYKVYRLQVKKYGKVVFTALEPMLPFISVYYVVWILLHFSNLCNMVECH